jgi:transketolase
VRFARQLRADSIRASTAAGSGHPTSSLSAADLMAVLLVGHLRYDWAEPRNPANDHLIFSKGHASPLAYALFRAAGAITDEELLTFRKLGSRLEGHPTPVLPWVDVATGSLGQGLPDRGRVALAGSACSAPRTTCGRSPATASSPRARSGRASTTPGTSASRTSPRSST